MIEATDTARILLCDDSPSYREAMTWFLHHDRDLRVVGAVSTAEAALASVHRLTPDLVVMDHELPGLNGTEAVKEIMARFPTAILLLSAGSPRGSARATAALAAGAVDARPKSDVSLPDPMGARAVAFRRYVKRLTYARVEGGRRRQPAVAAMSAGARSASAIGIAASTGGPQAFAALLSALPADFSVPILAVQHIARGFLDGLLSWLDGQAPLPVHRARDGAALAPGVWFAPDDAHLVVDRDLRTRFDHEAVAGWHRPAADVLFTSLAASAGQDAAAVVLTGMGSDGAEGVSAVLSAGGLVVAQDEASSAIYGMPRAAANHGAQLVLPLEQIGPTLGRLRPAVAA